MCRLGGAGESAAHTYTSSHTHYIDLPLHVLFFLRSQNQVLRLEGIITESFAALAFAHSVIPGRVVSLVTVLFVFSRNTLPLPGFTHYLFDEL